MHRNLPELSLVIRHCLLGYQTTLVQILLDGQKDLIRIDRLNEVIRYFRADGLLHDLFLFALGDHDHRQVGTLLLDALEGFQSVQPRHLLIQKHEIKHICSQQIQGFYTAVHRGHVKAFALQKKHMGLEQINFVIGP